MSVWSRFLRYVPGRGPLTHLPDCHTAIEMKGPAVTLVQRTTQTDSRAEKRMIGLALQENGVRIDVEAINASELAADLETARQWIEHKGEQP